MKVIRFPSPGARKEASLLRLPVAPRANNRIRFASTLAITPAMLPLEALAWLDEVLGQGKPVTTVEINGPGDPLSTPKATMETLRLVRSKHPQLYLCLTTLGIGTEQYAQLLADAGVRQVTLLMDALDPEVAAKLYAWIRPANKTVPLAKGVAILFDEQAKAMPALLAAGIEVRVHTTVYPGYNEAEVEKIASLLATMNVQAMTIAPFTPTVGEDNLLPPPDHELMAQLRQQAAQHLTILEPVADAALSGMETVPATPRLPSPAPGRPNVAVASSNGVDIDLHLGQASKILIYGPREQDGLPCLLTTRIMPAPGSGSARWETLAAMLDDCFALLTASAGDSPKKILLSHGISVLISSDGGIAETVDVLYGGGKKGKKCRK